MSSAKITVVVLLVVWFVLVSNCDGWRRRRRRRCPRRDCQVSSWSSWGQCTADQCGQQGSQSRSRTVQSSPSCGGAQCPDLHETRHCYSTVQVNCELGPWSEWSACSTPCGALGIQTSLRHRAVVEQCGGTCTATFSKTRSCPDISCLNGGTVKDRTCFCKKGYGGNCCEKQGETQHCSGNTPVDCQLSSWSEWSACSTPCGASGIQTSLRHRIVVEQCGGTCTATFSKTRSCPDISCLNGGTVKDRTCFCKKGYGGNCCEKQGPDKGLLAGIITPCVVVFICFVGVMIYCWKKK